MKKINKQDRKFRSSAVNNIEVQYKDNVFQGDEVSQNRLSNAINGLNDNELISWKTKDNKFIDMNREELKMVLRLAGAEQTKIWKSYK